MFQSPSMKRLILTVLIYRGHQISHFSTKSSTISTIEHLQSAISKLFRNVLGPSITATPANTQISTPGSSSRDHGPFGSKFSVDKFMTRNEPENDEKYEFLGINLTKDWSPSSTTSEGYAGKAGIAAVTPDDHQQGSSRDCLGSSTKNSAIKQRIFGEDGYDLMQSWDEEEDEKSSQKPKSASDGDSAELTHVDERGRARMVDVGRKPVTRRTASARASVQVTNEIMLLLRENRMRKGDVLTVAQVAGIFGAKKTAELIPLCHNITLSDIQVRVHLDEPRCKVIVDSCVKCDGRTGAEMEALTACSVAALTVYDMCKALSKDIVISDVRLLGKSGGKSDDFKTASDDKTTPYFFDY